MKTILILFGGCSTEYSVSLQSAHAVLTHLDPARYQALPVGITQDGQWLVYTGNIDRLTDDSWQSGDCVPCTLLLDRGARRLLLLDGSGRLLSFDAALPMLHGKNGEDGTVQGLLELADIPVIGCGSLSSALCMDKDRAHKLVRQAGIRVPRSTVFRRGVRPEELQAAGNLLGYPLFVKPVRAGSSFGVSRVTEPAQLQAAADSAFAIDREILLEEAISGFEVGCAVLGTETLTVGAVDEIELAGGFFDFEEKYSLKTSAIHCPARIRPDQVTWIQSAAKAIYRVLDCKGFARVDLFLTPQGELVFNEVNTIPGFTAHSRYPNMMRQVGLDFSTLITRMIETEVGA
jgi:D-alanine---D-serine ligase